jgi:hypothetical protein
VVLNSIRKSRARPKLKLFLWLLMVDRLDRRDLMARRQWHLASGYNCVLCNNLFPETRDHLFFECDFPKRCFDTISSAFHREVFSSSFTLCWFLLHENSCICCIKYMEERIELIFENQLASFNRWRVHIQHDRSLHLYN